MQIRARDRATPFTTADGSTIRSLLDLGTAPVRNVSLAEATLGPGEATTRHHHRVSEEIYYLVEGSGAVEIDGETAPVAVGDAILIPPGAWHRITAGPDGLRLLCACAPPYRDADTFFSASPRARTARSRVIRGAKTVVYVPVRSKAEPEVPKDDDYQPW